MTCTSACTAQIFLKHTVISYLLLDSSRAEPPAGNRGHAQVACNIRHKVSCMSGSKAVLSTYIAQCYSTLHGDTLTAIKSARLANRKLARYTLTAIKSARLANRKLARYTLTAIKSARLANRKLARYTRKTSSLLYK